MRTNQERDYCKPGRYQEPVARKGPTIEMYGPVSRAGTAEQQDRVSIEADAKFRRLKAMEAAGIGRELTDGLREEIRASLDILSGVDVPAEKGIGQGGRRHSHQAIARDFI